MSGELDVIDGIINTEDYVKIIYDNMLYSLKCFQISAAMIKNIM